MTKYILIATIIYAIINLIIGVIASKNISYSDFVSNKSKSNSTLITLSLIATIVGGGMFFATAQIRGSSLVREFKNTGKRACW